jgi:hypothetical protein
MGKFGKELIESLQQAAKLVAGKKVRAKSTAKSGARIRKRIGKALIAAMQASPHRDLDIEPERTPMRARK